MNSATPLRIYAHVLLHSFYSEIEATPQLKRLVAAFPPRRPGVKPGSGQVGFVVNKVALEQVFSEYFGFPCQFFILPNSPSS
jgi:hypothetical protein